MSWAKVATGPKAGSSSQGLPARPATGGQNPSPVAKAECLPTRPDSASNPDPIRLDANYFNLKLKQGPLTVYKYTFKVLGKTKRELRGATAKRIFEAALIKLKVPPHRYATDFQQHIVTLEPLAVPGKTPDNKEGWLNLTDSAIEFESTLELQLDAAVLPSPSPDVIDCLNLITGQRAREQEEIATIGRHRFFPESLDYFRKSQGQLHLGERFKTLIPESLSVVRGFFQSVRPAEDKLFLNANTTFAVFRPVGNIGKICDILWGPGKSQVDWLAILNKLHGAISKARVSYELPKDPKNPKNSRPAKIARIAGFARINDKDSRDQDPEHSLRFRNDFPGSKEVEFWFNGGHRTVEKHFKTEHRLDIRSNLPLVNIGKPSRPEYVPAEYCSLIWGQPVKYKVTEIPDLDRSKLDDLNKFTCRPPDDNLDWIQLVHERLKFIPGSVAGGNQVLKNFGVTVDQTLLKVTGRKLTAPNIQYLNKKAQVSRASWNLTNTVLSDGARKEWAWIYFGGDNENDIHKDADAGAKKLHEHLQKMCGKSFPESTGLRKGWISTKEGIDSLRKLFAWAKNNKLFVVIVCPNKLSVDTYNAIKFLGDIQFGLHTSVILASKFRKRKGKGTEEPPFDDSYFANVALKINLKLGGINHTLEKQQPQLSNSSTALMVVGYDVTHPTEDEKSDTKEGGDEKSGNTEAGVKGPDENSEQPPENDNLKDKSQVGLVISADDQLGQWLSYYWNQTSRQEMTDATIMEAFEIVLQAWKAAPANKINIGKKSLDVVIYRDGVSESQFDQVLKREVPKIKEAYKKVFPGKLVRITLVVAIKRHTTRFFPTDSKANENIPPGTVVDNGVTQPKYWEFFMAAHFAIQGTAKPTRYVVVLDDIFLKDYRHQSPNSAELLENFTHDMSYLFGRATRAVSVCTPAYYADILCTRARAYMSALANPDTRSMIEESIANGRPESQKRVLDGKIHPDLARSMYWI